jgi:hypothetical protein
MILAFLGATLGRTSTRLAIAMKTLERRNRGRRLSTIGPAAALAFGFAVSPVFPQDASNSSPIRIAVFDFELEDLTPAASLLGSTAGTTRMDEVSMQARQELAHSGRYSIIDTRGVDAQTVTRKSLRDCGGCEAGIALQLGAEQSLVGVVRRVTQTDYYVVIQIRDAHTGKLLDQQEANFAGSEEGWASGVRMLIKHQVLATN